MGPGRAGRGPCSGRDWHNVPIALSRDHPFRSRSASVVVRFRAVALHILLDHVPDISHDRLDLCIGQLVVE